MESSIRYGTTSLYGRRYSLFQVAVKLAVPSTRSTNQVNSETLYDLSVVGRAVGINLKHLRGIKLKIGMPTTNNNKNRCWGELCSNEKTTLPNTVGTSIERLYSSPSFVRNKA